MNPHAIDRDDFGDRACTESWHPNSGPIALLHVAITCAAVVGFFAAAAQPLGWSSVLQALLCTAIGGALYAASPKEDAARRAECAPAPLLARHRALRHDL